MFNCHTEESTQVVRGQGKYWNSKKIFYLRTQMEDTRSEYTNYGFVKSEIKNCKNVNYEFETRRDWGRGEFVSYRFPLTSQI